MSSSIPYFKNEPIVVLLLGFLTCGLYLIYWNIKTAEVLNAVAGKEVISQPIAIFAGCCMPVEPLLLLSRRQRSPSPRI